MLDWTEKIQPEKNWKKIINCLNWVQIYTTLVEVSKYSGKSFLPFLQSFVYLLLE